MKETDSQIIYKKKVDQCYYWDALFVNQRNLASSRLDSLNFYWALLVLKHHYHMLMCWAIYYCEIDYLVFLWRYWF